VTNWEFFRFFRADDAGERLLQFQNKSHNFSLPLRAPAVEDLTATQRSKGWNPPRRGQNQTRLLKTVVT
jgi:hypothetical protein